MMSILLYVSVSPEIVEKAWTTLYKQRYFDSRFKVKQSTGSSFHTDHNDVSLSFVQTTRAV